MDDVDLIIVGGGIAGGALATVMARDGARVLVLERQVRHRDRVRGEIIWPWGVRAARELGIEPLLLDAGGRVVRWFETYDEGSADRDRDDIAAVIDGVDGSVNLAHPIACRALIESAMAAGADVRFGVREVEVTSGSRPLVRWAEATGETRVAGTGLIVGADGRGSSVRHQAGIPFEIDPPAHLIAGLLVEAIDGSTNDSNLFARASDLLFLAFPQHGGRVRLYLCFPIDQRSRFAGPDGTRRFLDAAALSCLEGVMDVRAAQPVGPCATFPGEDSRAVAPFREGIVLIGDAAGYDNPVNGQGLSMTLQDVLDVSRAMRSGSPSTAAFQSYADARAARQHLANMAVAVEVWANDGFRAQDPAERASRYERIRGNGVLADLENSFWRGFDFLPEDLTAREVSTLLQP